MVSRMETTPTPEQHSLVRPVLVAQTESLGTLEIPVVEDILRKHGCRRVLDIGCGEGSFLYQLATSLEDARFVGIDHNEQAVTDAERQRTKWPKGNVELRVAFFDPHYELTRYDAALTRYTLQHSSDPRAFMAAVFERLEQGSPFVALESLDAYTDCQERDPLWERYRNSIAAIHERIGSNGNIGKSLGRLFSETGFRDVRVLIVLCSPSTVGWRRFRAVVQASAELAFAFFPDLFDRELLDGMTAWLADRAELERKDPYICSAIAVGIRP